jgi:hypothetical protein
MGLIHTQLSFNDGDMTVNRMQDVEPHMEHAARLRSAGMVGSPEMRHAAILPNALVEAYLNDHGITLHEFVVNPEHLRRMLNSPEFSNFRIWQGKV